MTKIGYRTPDIFSHNVEHKIARQKIYDKIIGYVK